MKRNHEIKYHLAMAAVLGTTLLMTSWDRQRSTGETAVQKGLHHKTGGVGPVMEDSAITVSIKNELLKNLGLSALKVDVHTLNGVVTLNGEADSGVTRARAELIAAATAGVLKLNNAIRVKPKLEQVARRLIVSYGSLDHRA